MQRFMKAQAAAQGNESQLANMAANLEINPKHPVVARLREMVSGGGDSQQSDGQTLDVATGFAELLYDVAAVSSGYELTDPTAFAKRVVALMSDGETALADLVATVAGSGSAGEEKKEEEKGDEGDGDDDGEAIVPEVV